MRGRDTRGRRGKQSLGKDAACSMKRRDWLVQLIILPRRLPDAWNGVCLLAHLNM